MKTSSYKTVSDVIDHLGQTRPLFSQAYKRRLIKNKLRQLVLLACAALALHGLYGIAKPVLGAWL
jgi:hypothetical protein